MEIIKCRETNDAITDTETIFSKRSQKTESRFIKFKTISVGKEINVEGVLAMHGSQASCLNKLIKPTRSPGFAKPTVKSSGLKGCSASKRKVPD